MSKAKLSVSVCVCVCVCVRARAPYHNSIVQLFLLTLAFHNDMSKEKLSVSVCVCPRTCTCATNGSSIVLHITHKMLTEVMNVCTFLKAYLVGRFSKATHKTKRHLH
ncbi:hypothetical protein O6H91_10G075300 [Diphasiastrum complanatum]|uniref:Uncharacterized protein n=1 Tax=Diphasiastrum complanatum TaxID=34168 RepID=A0ACC2CIK8_DIPCM|nr:hypothetical protein O6H91_10G075300 [Diphasiastrum complanatum]